MPQLQGGPVVDTNICNLVNIKFRSLIAINICQVPCTGRLAAPPITWLGPRKEILPLSSNPSTIFKVSTFLPCSIAVGRPVKGGYASVNQVRITLQNRNKINVPNLEFISLLRTSKCNYKCYNNCSSILTFLH